MEKGNQQPSPVEMEGILFPFKEQVDALIQKNMLHFGNKSPLRDACEYALLNGGKRVRPSFVLMIAKALGLGADASQAALAVEYFHTASLIADDLPCMDNDDQRRNKPSVHKVFGEALALLASYALIAEGYRCIARNAEELRHSSVSMASCDRICTLAIENASFNSGILGATGGQFLDLFSTESSIAVIQETIQKKTVTLFEISFVLGWLFGGGAADQLDFVKKTAHHFGMAFQIADDLSDFDQDSKHEKTVNLAIALGREKAKDMFHEEIRQLAKCVDHLNLRIPELNLLQKALFSQVEL